jgi:gliding motility-associated-like protein
LSDGAIDFTMLGGTPVYTYSWTDSNSVVVGVTEDLTGLPAGEYSVSAVDMNGCFIDTSIILTEPPILVGVTSVTSDYNGEDISCFDVSDGSILVVASGGTPAITYAWTDEFGNPVGSNPSVSGLPDGTYTVVLTDVNGCEFTKEIVLTEPPELTLTIDILSDYFGLPISCAGQTDGEIEAAVGGGTLGYTYSWNTVPVQTNAILSNIGEGTYVVTVVDTNGCTISETITLEGNPLPVIAPDGSMEVCQGETVTFSSNSNAVDACQWNFSNGMVLNDCGPNTLYIADVGCYDATLIVTGPLGCIDSVELIDYICIRPNPVAAFSASTYEASVFDTDVNFINESTGATDYLWDFNDGSTSTSVDVFHQFPLDQPGDYYVVLTAYNEYGCTDSASAVIHIKDEILFYIPNTFTPDGNQYNNTFGPVIGAGVSVDEYHFLVFNRWGEIVFESTTLHEMWDGAYLGNPCQDGTYTWKLFVRASDDSVQAGEQGILHGHVNILR